MMKALWNFAIVVVALFNSGIADAQTTPIEYSPLSSEPEDLVATDEGLFFTADDGLHGRELWYLDSLDGAPHLVWDQEVGPQGSELSQLYSVGDRISFNRKGNPQNDLWLSDGTRAGTEGYSLADYTGVFGYSGPMGIIGRELIFMSDEVGNVKGVWSLNLDTKRVLQLVSPDEKGFRLSVELLSFGIQSNHIFFGGRRMEPLTPDRAGLYRTDGTPQGTVEIKATYEAPTQFFAMDEDKVLFQVNSKDFGHELWISDGTESGTKILKDTVPGTGSSSPGEFAKLKGRNEVYFSATHPDFGRELWITDGTETGTRMVKDILPGAGNGDPYKFVTTHHRLFFIANGPGQGRELWTSQGTSESTIMLKEIYPGPPGSEPYAFCMYKDVLYFSAKDPRHGEELWRSDGTPEGTWLLADVNPGPESSEPYFTTVFGGHIVFAARHGLYGRELWVTNGRKDGTRLLLDLAQDGQNNPSSSPQGMTATKSLLFFAADDVRHGMELWATDGTPENTRMVRDIFPGRASSDPQELLAFEDTVFFRADNGTHGTELWVSDGTELGTKMVENVSFQGSSGPRELTRFKDHVVFVANSDSDGAEVWIGDASGAEVLMDIRPGTEGSNPKDLTVWNDRLYFTADDGVHGEELWVSTGRKDETHMVTDIISLPVEQAGGFQAGPVW